ncbi:MAG: InlB B-repeat-containing protein [Clostridia bacterium]|nr:InlB B-repeat-containing protein [Clostridia bacterium]
MKKLLAIMLALIMVLALVPTVAFAEEALNTDETAQEDTAVLASANARGIFTSNIKIDAYEGKGFDFIEKNKLGVAFEYKGSQVGSGKVYILKDYQLTGNASNNTGNANPGIIIKEGIAYKFSHAGVLGNYTKLKYVYYDSSKEQWYYNYSSSIVDIVVAKKGQINFAYEKTGNNTYTLKYDANGGEDAPESATQVKKSLASATFTISSEKPFRNGYNFLGWADTEDGTVKYKAGEDLTLTYTSEVTEKTIYAVWEKIQPPVTIYITYNGNAGNDVVSNLPDPTTSTIPNGQYDAPFTISDKVPTRNDYDFLGWADSADAAEPQYQPGNTINVSGDKCFYAVWKATEIKPDIPNPTPDNIDGNIQVKVICTSANKSQTYGLVPDGFTYTTPTLNNDGVYECTIKAIPSVYCDKYSADTGITHETDTDYNNNNLNARTLTLKYEDNTWKPIGYVNPLPVGVKCEKDSHGEQQETFPGVITVKKTVESNDPADKNKEFNFKVTVITDPNPDPSGPPIAKSANAVKAPAARGVDKTATNKDFKRENNGNWTFYFTLKDGDTMTISNLPVGFIYRVDELDAAGYTVTVNNEPTSSKDVGLTKEKPEMTLEFKNTKGSTPTPTPTPYNGGGGYFYPTTTPVPVIVIPPKTGDMTVWQSILHFLGIR